jgi:glucose-1-phosphate adenylyltransferase
VRIRRAILDEHVAVPDGTAIGYDVDHDRRQYHRTESGIVVVEGHAPSERWTR